MSEEQAEPGDAFADLAEQLAQPSADLGARVAVLDEAVARLQAALTALDEV
ncbi:MAG: hypothetical protein ACRDTP_05645 [Mycobacteriales bacterium]